MTSVVDFSDVTVSFNGRSVVDGVSFDVAAGEWVAVLGPNGAGKSTLLRTLVGGPTTRGRVMLDGEDASHMKRRQRGLHIAYVPQTPIYPQGMAVFDYVLLGRTPHLGRLAAERSEDIGIVWEALDDLDLMAFADRDVASLSGGETQRVALARVIAQRAPVLVLDEATAALDVARQHQVLELIDRVRKHRGIAVVSAMHDLTAAAQFCDRVAVMDDGVLSAMGPPAEILTEERLQKVFEPSVRVLDIEGSHVIVSMRAKEST